MSVGPNLWKKEGGAVGFSSKSVEWDTPAAFFQRLDLSFSFTLDPCATERNAKCSKFYTIEQNGLEQDWGGETVFVNPPYGRGIGAWVEKAYKESKKHNTTVVMLIPSRTDTKWWHNYVMKAKEVYLLKGRLKFGDSKNAAPFPSAVVVFESDSLLARTPSTNPRMFSLERT